MAIRRLQQVLWVLLLLVLIAATGCTVDGFTSRVTAPPYKLYSPGAHSLFQLQFEYPATWDLLLGPETSSDIDLWLSEASAPTSIPGQLRNPDEPLVGLYARRVDASSFSLDQEVDRFLAGSRDRPFETIAADETSEIDGYSARKTTLLIEPPQAEGNSTMLHEDIFLLVDSCYYQLHMQIPEQAQHGAFAQGFQHLIESIEIMH